MRLSLYQKLAISIAGLFIIIASLFIWWTQTLSNVSRAQAEQQLHLRLGEHLVADNPLLKQGVYDYKALENLFHTLMVLGPSFEFYFIDPAGNVLTFSAKPGEVKRHRVDLVPLIKLIERPNELPVYGDNPRALEGEKIFSVSPVYNGETLQGYLYVIIGSTLYDSIFSHIKSSEQLLTISVLLAFALCFLLLVMLILFKNLTTPVTHLNKYIQEVESANFNLDEIPTLKWQNKQHNEIYTLGLSVNNMVNTISQQMGSLTELDEQRRQLLAHLSHDLRTPLASLQGYLEILNNHASSQKMQNKYINITLKNCAQLKTLIDQIFELAHLESGQTSVKFEVFYLGELIYDVFAKFSLLAEKKQISLCVTPQQCDVKVYSDIAKLERVLTNLIENAIRHTPEHGKVSIHINEYNGHYILNIKDTGIGISEKELPYIFEARYRASNSKGCKNSHAGLGLAITSRLIGLLQTEIKVTSQEGKGTEFSFTLRSA